MALTRALTRRHFVSRPSCSHCVGHFRAGCALPLPASMHCRSLHCAHPQISLNRTWEMQQLCLWNRTLQRQLMFANNEKRHLCLASELPTGKSDGGMVQSGEAAKDLVCGKPKESWNLWTHGLGCRCPGPDLPQAEQQARAWGPLSLAHQRPQDALGRILEVEAVQSPEPRLCHVQSPL